jgi:hypothetical protein
VRGGTLLFRNSQTGGKIIPCVKNRVYIVVSLAPYLQLSAHSIHEPLDEVFRTGIHHFGLHCTPRGCPEATQETIHTVSSIGTQLGNLGGQNCALCSANGLIRRISCQENISKLSDQSVLLVVVNSQLVHP